MRGVEGAIFSPMSHTYAFALTTAILLAVTLSPVLSSILLRKGMEERRNFIWLAISRFYHNLFVGVLQWPRLSLALIALMVAGGLSLFPRLGGEFLPKLEEGNIWAHAIMPTTINLPRAARLVSQVRPEFLIFPAGGEVVPQPSSPV